jgi:hypothetical protein
LCLGLGAIRCDQHLVAPPHFNRSSINELMKSCAPCALFVVDRARDAISFGGPSRPPPPPKSCFARRPLPLRKFFVRKFAYYDAPQNEKSRTQFVEKFDQRGRNISLGRAFRYRDPLMVGHSSHLNAHCNATEVRWRLILAFTEFPPRLLLVKDQVWQ